MTLIDTYLSFFYNSDIKHGGNNMKKIITTLLLAVSLMLTACSNSAKPSDTSSETTTETTTEATTTTTEATTTTTEATTISGVSLNDLYEATKVAIKDYINNTNCYPIDKSNYQDTFIKDMKGYSFSTIKCNINYWIIEFDASDSNCPKVNVGDRFTLTNSSGKKDDGYTVTAINGNYILALNEIDNKTYSINWGSTYSEPTAKAIYDAFVSLKK